MDGSVFDEFKAMYGTTIVTGSKFSHLPTAPSTSPSPSPIPPPARPSTYFSQDFLGSMDTQSESSPTMEFCFPNPR